MKVLAAMSGGVDSAVAAARLVAAGHDVTGDKVHSYLNILLSLLAFYKFLRMQELYDLLLPLKLNTDFSDLKVFSL